MGTAPVDVAVVNRKSETSADGVCVCARACVRACVRAFVCLDVCHKYLGRVFALAYVCM